MASRIFGIVAQKFTFTRKSSNTMSIADKTVSRLFRDLMQQTYPQLDDDPVFWYLAGFILFGAIFDADTGHLRISQATLAEITNQRTALRNHRFAGKQLLDRFSTQIARINYSNWSYREERARTIQNTVFPPDILQAAEKELLVLPASDRVYFGAGEKFSRGKQQQVRERERSEARIQVATCAVAQQLLDYLNIQSPNRYTHTLQHLPEARAAVERLTDERKARALKIDDPVRRRVALDIAERLRVRQLTLLHAIYDQPQPFYKPTERSVRIFPANECILRLKREVRRVMLQDWMGFDLRSAQLAIIARVWEVHPVQAFLARDRSIWDEFAAYFHVELDGTLKDACKHALYALMFGASQQRISCLFSAEGYPEAQAKRFLQHPLVQAMLMARKAQFRRIVDAGGAENCFGQWIAIPQERHTHTRRAGPNVRSVLAQLAQAWELRLLAPVIDLARSTDQFTITTWLHDGFYVDVRDSARATRWGREITKAVDREAHSLGFLTRLERAE
jgi:hypothetical protein